MPEMDSSAISKKTADLEMEIERAKKREAQLRKQLELAQKRVKVAVNGYKIEREKRKEAENALKLSARSQQTPLRALRKAIISRIPDQMMIFTYHDGIDPKQMKFVWFKHPDPNFFISSILKKDPTGDFLADHISENMMSNRMSILKGIHDNKKYVVHEYPVPKVVIINGKRKVQRGEREWRRTTYFSLNGKDKVFAFVRDITPYKQATFAVEEKDKLKIALFENLKDMVFISTPDGRFFDLNAAASDLLGYSANELLLIKIEELYSDAKLRAKFLKQINRHGFVKDYETVFRHKNGTEIPVMITATPFELQGKGMVFQGVVRDISQLKKHEQMQGVLAIAGSVLHGFAQPLQSISSLLDCMSEDLNYMVKGVGEVLHVMIESKLDRTKIEEYSKRLNNILLEPMDPEDPSLPRTLDDINGVKKAYANMSNLISEIRGIGYNSGLEKVTYDDSSQIIGLKSMGGFEEQSEE